MKLTEEHKKRLFAECTFSASRSSGPGGQHVNKVNTQVELRFSVNLSEVLLAGEKEIVKIKLKNKINANGELILVSSAERSQWRNKEEVTNNFYHLLEMALRPIKKRIRTSPTKSSRLKRLHGKKVLSQKKTMRKRPEF